MKDLRARCTGFTLINPNDIMKAKFSCSKNRSIPYLQGISITKPVFDLSVALERHHIIFR